MKLAIIAFIMKFFEKILCYPKFETIIVVKKNCSLQILKIIKS